MDHESGLPVTCLSLCLRSHSRVTNYIYNFIQFGDNHMHLQQYALWGFHAISLDGCKSCKFWRAVDRGSQGARILASMATKNMQMQQACITLAPCGPSETQRRIDSAFRFSQLYISPFTRETCVLQYDSLDAAHITACIHL